MRWEYEAERALNEMGYDVVSRDGCEGYEGWGVLMGRSNESFAILNWTYGTCSGCDPYEDMTEDEVVDEMKQRVATNLNSSEAQKLFESMKSW